MSQTANKNFFLKEEGRRLIKVGLFLAAAVVSVIVLVSVLGRARSIFSNKVHIFAYFEDVKGLATGAPVLLSGKEIGVVQHIDYLSQQQARQDHPICAAPLFAEKKKQKEKNASADPSRKLIVRVDFNIPEIYLNIVSVGSVVNLTTKGLLGDKILNIVPGAIPEKGEKSTQIQSGGCLIAGEDDVIAQARQVMDNIDTTVQDVNERIQALLTDDLGRNLNRLLAGTAALLERAQKGPGFLHDLLFDPTVAADARRLIKRGQLAVAHFDEALKQLRVVLGSVDKGVRQMTDQEKLSKLVAQVTRAAGTLGDVAKQLKPLVSDKQVGKILTDAAETMKMVREVVGQVHSGRGDVRRLIKDLSEAASKLSDLLGEAKQNPAVRSFLHTLPTKK